MTRAAVALGGAGAVFLTVQASDTIEPAATADSDIAVFRGLEDLRDDAAGAASRNEERDPDSETGDRADEPENPQATVLEPPSGEPASDDDASEDAGDGGDSEAEDSAPARSVDDGPASSLPGGFPAIDGCSAEVPAEGSVANGQLSDEQLCDVGDGHLLRSDAAAAFQAMAEAYEDETGRALLKCIGNTYRTYDQQVDLARQKPGLAAEPGTSEHGWGLAIDFECGANSYSSSFYAWLDTHGQQFGWINPSWARSGGSRPEPWHWEFDPGLVS
nr:M15 family metallopeptidase [Phytoactinopolyspora alkaliphila]